MTRHVSTEKLARFADGKLRRGAASRVEAHLAGCARCREDSDALARLPGLLAAADPPQIPAHLAARIEMALATESAHRAAGAPSMRGSRPGRLERAGNARRARRPSLAVLALTAAAVVVAGGSYEAVSHLGTPGATSSSGASADGSSVRQAPERAGKPAFSPGALRVPPAYGPAVPYRRAGGTGTFRPVRTTTDYQPTRLARQVAAILAAVGSVPAGVGPHHTASSPGALAGFSRATLAGLSGCVGRIAAGRNVLLVNVARFRAAPATIIVTATQGSAAAQIWVVGPGCSRSAGDVLAHRPLPGR